MSTLSQKEKQALNELFMSLGEKKDRLFIVKKCRDQLILLCKYLLRYKKAKHTSV